MNEFRGESGSSALNSVRRGLLAAVWMGAMGSSLVLAQGISAENAKIARAKAELTTLASCNSQFRLDCDRYPSSSERLKALLVEPGKLNSWRGR